MKAGRSICASEGMKAMYAGCGSFLLLLISILTSILKPPQASLQAP